MREIKFRAWDSKKNKMYSAEELGNDEMQLNPDGRGFFNSSSVSPKLSHYFIHLVPLQYTGLKDKNGKEIYEGDIIKNNKLFGQVDMRIYNTEQDTMDETEHCGWIVFNDSNPLNRWLKTLIDFSRRGEIIGNIYENPELLK